MQVAFLTLVFVASLITLSNWRSGLFAIIVVGVLQDPLRKMTENVPAYFLLGSVIVFAILMVSLIVRNSLSGMNAIYLGDRNIKNAWSAVVAIVILQAVHTLLRWGSPSLMVLGIMQYILPVLALLVGFALFDSEKAIRRFMLVYILITVPACLTIFLSVNYSDIYPVLKDIGAAVGGELVIYDVGAALESYPGIYRVGEIAAWHAATAATFLVILATKSRSILYRILAALLVVLLVGAILYTGRRKMLMALTIFLVSQWSLLAFYHKGAGRLAITIVVLGVVGSFAFTLLDPVSESSLYVQRGATVFESVGQRLHGTFQLFQSAINRSSGIGLGVGVAAQGGHYASGIGPSVGGAGEAGVGKIILELGVLGALALLWFILALVVRIFKSLHWMARTSYDLLFYSVSFLSILIANIATFMVATQLFGDFFILTIIGLIFGALMSLIRTGQRLNYLQRKKTMFVRSVANTALN